MVLSMERWFGKVALVTGASSGIGQALSERLVEEGLTVVGVARRVERIEEIAKKLAGKKGKLFAFKADLTKEEDILNVFNYIKDNFKVLHILVNNAGIFKLGLLSNTSNTDLRNILELNVLALSIATKEAINIMKDNKIDGHIINVNSIAGQKPPVDGFRNMYPASKFAVTALTEGIRQELRQLNTKIKITSVSPGLVKTEMALAIQSLSEEQKNAFANRPSLQAEDIVDGIIYALSTAPHVQIHELTIKPVGEPY